jgi:hypothetical protein
MLRYSLWVLLISSLLIASCGADPTPTAPPTPTLPAVNALAALTLRSGPGGDYGALSQVPQDATLELLGSARGSDCTEWVLVRTSAGDEGWVRPILVNVDAGKSVLQPIPLPTPETPLPVACSGDLALVEIENNFAVDLEVYMAGPEPGFTLSIQSGAARLVCLTPGEYCYDLTDGEKHETGSLFFPGADCTCWHWGGGFPTAGSCRCTDDAGFYQRP